jgi:hypothetical protein
MVGGPLIGYLADRIAHELSIIQSCAILSLILIFYIIDSHSLDSLVIEFAIFIYGVLASSQALVWKLFHELSHGKVEGVGVGISNSLIMLVVATLQIAMGYLLANFTSNMALYVLPGSIIAGVILSIILTNKSIV